MWRQFHFRWGWGWFIGAVVAVVAGVSLSWLQQPGEADHFDGPLGSAYQFGWINDPTAVEEVIRDLGAVRFHDTPAYRCDYRGPDDLFLWEACRQVTGDLLPARNQGQVGSCVGFGFATAIEHLLCVRIVNGEAEQFRELAPEVIYGGSRVQIGGGRLSGDGSTGAWAAKFLTQYGIVPRDRFSNWDLRRYTETNCRRLGAVGLDAELIDVARQHPVRAVANVRSWAECQAAIRNGYPIAVRSSQGFRMNRDADGFGIPHGTWMHCMAAVGVCGGRRPGAFLLNSWGDTAHPGPLGPGQPPRAGFWVDAAVIDRMLRQGDSWAISAVNGFPAQRLDWYAGAGSDGGNDGQPKEL